MIPKNLPKLSILFFLFALLFSTHFSFGQCPQAANAVITANPITCFNDANGSIKIVLNDSTTYKGVTVQFVLQQQIGGVYQTVTTRSKGLPYNATFANLAAGTYRIEVTTRPTTVPPNCGVITFTTPNVFVPSPAGSFAGYEQYLCDSTYTVMGADDPAPSGAPASTGKWTTVSGPSTPTFSDNTDPYAIVSNLVAGDYTFRWTVSKSGCPDRSSEVTIRKRNTPVANAGSDVSVCGQPSIPLNGNNLGPLYFGEWSQVSGPNSSLIANPASNSTTAGGLVAGVYSFQWILQDDIYACLPDTAVVTVTNNASPATFTANITPNPVCEGKPVTFGLSPLVATNTYTWTGPGGFTFVHTGAQPLPSITSAAPSNAGGYSVVAKTSLGCNSPSVSAGNLVVNAKPAKAGITASSNPVCQGSTLTLTAGGALPVTWTLPDLSTSNTNPLGIANMQASNAGKYKVFATSGICASDADSVTIAVTPVNTPTVSQSGTGTYCSGAGFTLTANPNIIGATYTWTTPSGGTVLGRILTVASASSTDGGTYSVKITANGCTGPAATTNVTINPAPVQPSAITGNAAVCQGDNNVGYSVTNVTGVTYTWTYTTGTGASITNSGSSASLNFSATATSGVLNVTATANACTSTVRSLNITVNPKPVTPVPTANSPVCAGQTINLSTPLVAGATYSWTGPNSFTSTLRTPSIAAASAANAGAYSVDITVGGCTSAQGSVSVVVNPVFTPTAASNTPICAGTALNLTASTVAGATYSWTGPNGFTSTLQNPTIAASTTAASGTYNVTATVAGCAGTAGTTSVTVNPVPVQPSAITGKTPVCPGETNVPYSVTSVAGVSYVWAYSGIGATITGNTNLVTISYSAIATSGTLSVNAVLGTCTSAVRTQAIVVNPIPAAPTVSSNSPVCAGSTINLTASTITGATYAWTGPNGFTSTIQNPTIANATAAAAGSYSVTVTVGGCTSTAASTNVSITALPVAAASNNGPICTGGSLQLTAATLSGATYVWIGPNSFNSTTQNPTISPVTAAAAGTYSLIVTQNSCSSLPSTTSVTINPTPTQPSAITGKTPVCAGESNVPYSVTAVAGVSYIWSYSGSGATITGTTNSVSVNYSSTATPGTLSVNAVLGACTSAVRTQAIVVNPIPATPTVTSNSPVCVGGTLNLSTPTVAGATYSWTGPNGFSSSIQNPSIVAASSAAAGTYSVIVTTFNCASAAGSATIVITPLPVTPTVSSNSPVCVGAALNLIANTITGATYAWTGPNGFTSSSQNPSIASVTASAAGTYSVIATVSGCNSSAATTSVVVNSLPATPTASSNSPLCVTSTLNLSASTVTGATYSWTGPNGFTSSLQNPSISSVTAIHAGTYSVRAILNGCSGAASTTTVVINPQPAAPIASSNSPVCVGGTINLTTPTVAGATYAWTGPNGFSSTSQNPTVSSVTTSAAGTYSVSTTVSNCTSLAGTTNVIITPLPTSPAASSNSPVCEGSALNLSATTIAGATYSWTGPNGFSSTLQNPSIASATSAAGGSYNVTAIVGGCNSPTGTTTVVITPLPSTPAASSNSPLCAGSTLNLSTPTVAGAIYAWTGPNGFSSTLQNPNIASVTPAASGTYSVTIQVGSCKSVAGTTSVVVNPIPTAPTVSSNSPVCAGSTVNLTTPTVAGAIYAWTGPNGFTSTSQNPSIASTTSLSAGLYSLITTVSGCTSLAGTTNVSITPLPSSPTASSNHPVCVGSPLNLTASTVAGATYTWTGPNGFTSTSQNPIIPSVTIAAEGIYSVSSTVSGCTSLVDTTFVKVTPLPAVPAASSNSPLCVTSTLNLAASTVAGAIYSWTGPNGFTSSLQNPTIASVTSANAGTYSVSAISNGCASASGTTTVVINTQPSAPTASSNSPVCVGATLNLTTPTVAGATYAWTGPNGFTSTSQNPSISSVTTAASGPYSVTTTLSNCTSLAGTTTVSVTPLPASPVASSNSPICAGGPLNLTATSVAGATYSWIGPNGFTSSLQNPTISAASVGASGTYSVTATLSGCGSTASTTSVLVNPIPASPIASSNSPLCVTSTLNLTATTVAGATYSWTGPNGFTSTLQNPTAASVTSANAGIYSVTATANGCNSVSSTTNVVINTQPAAPVVASNSPVCVGTALNLSTPTVAGATYSWTGPNGFTSTSQNPSIAAASATDAGTYSVTTTIGNCTSLAGTTTVSITSLPSSPSASSNTPVCVGAQINLTASTIAGATYAWTGPNGFTSSLKNPTIPTASSGHAGTYSVSAKVGSCTSLSSTTSVVVNPLPATPSAFSNTPVCEGATLSLSAGAISGATYSWSGPNGFTSTLQNPTLASTTTLASGTYSVTATVLGCTGSAGTTTVTIVPIPTQPSSITGNAIVCQGAKGITYSVTNDPSVTYVWAYSGTGATITGSGNNVSVDYAFAATAGNLTVTAVSGACSSAVRSLAITINPIPSAPSASSNSPICAGSDLNLAATNLAGATYAWTGPNGFTSTAQNPTITSATIAASGTYSVVASVGGCPSASNTTSVLVNNTPAQPANISGSANICQTQSNVLYSTTAVTGVTYVWSYSGTGASIFVSGVNNVRLSFSSTATSGVLSVRAVAGACTSAVRNLSITVNPSPKQPVLLRSNSPLCVGQDLDLAVEPDANPLVNFSWTLPDNSTSAGTDFFKPSVGVSDQGNYLVTAFVAGGCLSPVLTIPVKVIPGFIPLPTSNSPICVGNDLTVSASGVVAPGASYTWTGPNGFTNANQSFTIANAQLSDSGTYKVVAHVGTCSSDTVSTNVKVNPVPVSPGVIAGDTGVCQGSTETYSISGAAGVTYTWNYTGTGASFPSGTTGSSITINFASNATSGNLQVVAVSKACSSSVSTLAIKLNPQPTTIGNSTTLTVCQNDTIRLSASTIAGATYSWSGPNGFTSSLQSPTLLNAVAVYAGAYRVTFSLNGCQGDTDTTNVTVNPVPDASFSYARSGYCQSEPNVQPVSVPVGSSFLSSPNGLSLNSSTGDITFTTSTAGTYTIVNTIVNGSGCKDTASFRLSVLKAPIARRFTYPSPICDASVLSVLPSFTSLGDIGIFKSTSGLSIDPTTGAVQPNASTSGTYQVVYASVAGACSDSTISNVTISPSPAKPSLTGAANICQGKSTSIFAALSGFSSFNWYKGATLVQAGGTSFNTTSAGDYFVNVTAANGCASPNSDTVSLVISPRPSVPVIDGVCTVSAPPATLTTQYSATTGYTYAWFRNNVSVGTTGTLTASSAGNYKTVVTETATGCTSDTSASVDPFGSGVTINIVVGSNPFCAGDSLHVASNSPSGNTWTLDGVPIATTPTTIIKTTGQLILTVTNGTCSGSDTLNVISNPTPSKPVLSSVSDSLCAGDSLILSTSATGTLQWVVNGVNVTGATTATLKIGQAGAYQVRASNGTCSAISDVKEIGLRKTPIKPILNLSGAQEICQGDSLELTVTNFVVGQDQWYLSSSAVSAPKGTSAQLFTSATGTYKVVRTSTGGCASISDSVSLIVNPSVAPSVTIKASETNPICGNIAIRYTATASNAGASPTYQWFINDHLVASRKTPVFLDIDTLTKTSEIKVTVISTNTCSSPKQSSDSIISTIVEPFKVQSIVTPIGCANANSGQIIFDITGGSGNYSFVGDLNNDTNTVISAQTYNTTIFDNATQCQVFTSVPVSKAIKFRLDAAFTQPTCYDKNGSVVLTAVPSGNYTVTSGALTLGTTTGLAAATYPVSVKNTDSGCSVDTTFNLTADGIFTTAVAVTEPDCGSNNGVVRITPSPAGAYTYFGDLNQAVSNNVAPGTYIVTTDNGKCPKNDTIKVAGKALFDITASVVQPTCVNPLGSITIGTSPVIGFSVSDDLSNAVNNNLPVGDYHVVVTDIATGCFKDSTFTLEQKRDFAPSFSVKSPLCFAKNGEIAIALSPDTAIYTITGNLVVGDNKNLDQGTYTFRAIRASTSCLFDTTISLVATGRFTTALSVVQPDCGSQNGSIQITPSPSGTYTYTRDLTQAFTNNLSPNTYIVNIKNPVTTCEKNDTILLNGKPAFAIEASVLQPSCTAKGSIKISTVPKIDFTVDLDLKDSVNDNLEEGIYKARITDKATLCFKDTSFTLKKALPFSVSATVIPPTCKQSDGAIYLGVSPGPNSNYTFRRGVNADTSRGLSAGTYEVLITEKSSGCVKDTVIELVSPADFTLSASMVKPLCGLSDGEIDLAIAPSPNSLYTFSGALTSDINKNLASGSYAVKVTDNNSLCELDTVLILGNQTDFVVTASIVNPSCSKTDGSIALNVSPGGNTGYDFTEDFAGTPVLTSLGAGSYRAIITRKNTSCFKDTTFILNPVATFTVSAALSHPSCNQADGSISITPSGVNYTYSGDLTQAVTTGLRADTFAVVVKDNTTGCSVPDTFILKNQVDFTVAASMTKPSCGLANGVIALKISPSPVTDYTFGPSGAFTSDTLKNIGSGTYRAVITRSGSTCSKDTTFTLGNQTPFAVTATLTNPSCNQTDGSITLNVSPGTTADYDFSGSFAGVTSLNNLGAGSYRAIVTPKNNPSCFKDTTFVLNPTATFSVLAALTHPSCNQADGSISIAPSGANYTYSGDLTQALTTGLRADTFAVVVKDNTTGCSVPDTFILKNQVDFTVAASMTLPACGLTNGVIALKISPSPVTSYVFGPGGVFTSDTLKNVGAGTYRAVISRIGSTCAKDTSFVLGNQTPFDVTATTIAPSCGKADGKIRLRATIGQSSDYTFGGDFTSDSLVNVGAGTYNVTVTSKSTSCILVKSFTLNGQADFTVASSKVVPSCNKSDGAIFLSIQPAPITNYIITGSLTSDTTRNLPAGVYNFSIQRVNSSCRKDTSIALSVPTSKVELGNGDTLCSDVAVTIKAKLTDSLNVPYTYVWYAGKDSLTTLQTINSISVRPTSSTTYYVYVSYNNSCPGVDSVRITKPATFKLENTSYQFSDDSRIVLNLTVTNPEELKTDKIYIMRKTNDILSDWRRIDSIPKTNTIYIDRPDVKGVYYYKVFYPGTNICGQPLETRNQRTLVINATADVENLTTHLDWTTFIRWDSTVFEYQIWRSLDNAPFAFYKSGNLDTLASYINGGDGQKQCYKVRAIEKRSNGNESWSNTVCLDYNLGIGIFNIFTPNGDGHNDVFFFKNIQFYPNNELTVFNRWGNKVYQKIGYMNEWDGGDLPAGTYFYVLDLKDGKTKVIYGDVLLHR